MKETGTSCACLLSEQHKKFVEENRHYMGAVWKSVRFCSPQGIGLRGHREDLGSIDKNPGNLSMLSEYDSVVKNRLNNSSSDKYTHHSIHNELITTVANIV